MIASFERFDDEGCTHPFNLQPCRQQISQPDRFTQTPAPPRIAPLAYGLDCAGSGFIDQTLLGLGAYCLQRIRVAQRGPHMLQGMVHKLAPFAFVESRDRLLQRVGIEPRLRKSSKCAARLGS